VTDDVINGLLKRFAAVRLDSITAASITLDSLAGGRPAAGGTFGELLGYSALFEAVGALTLATLAARSRRAARDASAHRSTSRSSTRSTRQVVELPL
jgi:hypothetical protein